MEWFENNNMKLPPQISGYKHENAWAHIGQTIIWESNKQRLVGLQIHRNLNFNTCLSSLCRKADKRRVY